MRLTLRRLMCGLFRAHEYHRAWTRNRIYLVCARCNHETPGWRVERPSASFIGVDQVRADRRRDLRRLQARLKLRLVRRRA